MPSGLQQIADGVEIGPLVPGPWLNLVVIRDPGGDVVVDTGMRFSRRRLTEMLFGREVAAHVVTHAHVDHLGSTSWLCRRTGASLQMGAGDAARFEDGRLDTHSGGPARAVARALDPERTRVDRHLREGDTVASFRVVEAPGHSPGNLALWREEDRVLVVGDAPVNVSRDATRPRWAPLPAGLHGDPAQVRASRQRLADLRPALVVPVHGRPVRAPDAWARAAVTGH